MRNLLSFELVFSYRQCVVFPCFQGFFFVFNDQNLSYHLSCHRFPWVYLFENFPVSWICRFVSFTRSGTFSPIIFLNSLSAHLFLFSLWESGNINIGSFVIVHSFSIYLLSFVHIKFCWPVFKFIDFVFCHLYYKVHLAVFVSISVSFSFIIFIWFFYLTSISLMRFSILLFV